MGAEAIGRGEATVDSDDSRRQEAEGLGRRGSQSVIFVRAAMSEQSAYAPPSRRALPPPPSSRLQPRPNTQRSSSPMNSLKRTGSPKASLTSCLSSSQPSLRRLKLDASPPSWFSLDILLLCPGVSNAGLPPVHFLFRLYFGGAIFGVNGAVYLRAC